MATNLWAQRVDEVLSDPKAARLAALLYWLVVSHINSPVRRKHSDAIDLLWEEANMDLSFVEKADSR